MSDNVLKAREIYKRLDTELHFNLTKARAKYRELFGISCTHDSIDNEYRAVVERHFGSFRMLSRTGPHVTVPLRIALAFYLRELRGRKREMPRTLRFAKIAQMEKAQRLKTKYMTEDGLSAGKAEEKAAQELQRTFEWRGERRSFMTVDQMLDWFRHPGRYGLPSARDPRR